MSFVRNFLFIVGAALGSSVLGALFACVVAWVSPDFVRTLFAVPHDVSVIRYAASLGMIWGLFLGTAVMGFSLLIATLVKLTRALDARRSQSPPT